MKKIIALLSLILMTTLLAACAAEPTAFGVPQSTWNTLSPQQKQTVIAGYNQRKAIKQQNAPLESAIGAASAILQNQHRGGYNSNFFTK